MFHISKTNWVEILLQEKEEGGGGAEKYLTFLFPGREGGGVGRAGVHPLFLEGTAESTWKFWSTTSRKRVANKIGSIFRFIFVFTKEERQQLSDFKVQRRGDRYETKSAYAGDFKLSMTDATYPFQVVIKIREQLRANRIDKVPHGIQLCDERCIRLQVRLSHHQSRSPAFPGALSFSFSSKASFTLIQYKIQAWCPDWKWYYGVFWALSWKLGLLSGTAAHYLFSKKRKKVGADCNKYYQVLR